MKEYEIVYIFDSQIEESKVSEKLEKYHALVADGNGGGEITAVDEWGRRDLAYPIRKRTSGYYVIAQFRGEAESLPELERQLKLDEEVLRYLIVLHQGEPTAPMSIATREPREDDEDDDDDGDEDEEE